MNIGDFLYAELCQCPYVFEVTGVLQYKSCTQYELAFSTIGKRGDKKRSPALTGYDRFLVSAYPPTLETNQSHYIFVSFVGGDDDDEFSRGVKYDLLCNAKLFKTPEESKLNFYCGILKEAKDRSTQAEERLVTLREHERKYAQIIENLKLALGERK